MIDDWMDMHVHTYYSDGILSPKEVVHAAKKAGLRAVGIVDHDTVNGLNEAEKEGKKQDIAIVTGTELSSQFKGMDIHILGYCFDRENGEMKEYLKKFQQKRYIRAEKMVSNLSKIGVKISMGEVINKAKGKNIGRPHIADVLLEKGYVETFQEAFYKYIGYNSESYVEKYKISPFDAIKLISKANGLSFLAHPGPSISDSIITDFAKAGLDGIEIVHPRHSESRTAHLQKLVRKMDLLVCGGSDCHGRNGEILIGRYTVPYAILEEFREVLRIRKEIS